MQAVLYVVEVDKAISDHANKLVALMREKGIEASSCTLDDYKRMTQVSVFNEAKYIFIGSALGKPAIPNVSAWQYERYGCSIGWSGNHCVISARASDLSHADYVDFREYCKGLQLENPDVVVPPENQIAESIERVKKAGCSVYRAQCSTLVYVFTNDYLDKFMNADSSSEDGEKQDITRKAALEHLTTKQARQCHAIIYSTALSCAATVPILMAEERKILSVTASQVSMVRSLGKVFGFELAKEEAQVLMKALAEPFALRAKYNGLASVTDDLGWAIVNDFVSKAKNTEPAETAERDGGDE